MAVTATPTAAMEIIKDQINNFRATELLWLWPAPEEVDFKAIEGVHYIKGKSGKPEDMIFNEGILVLDADLWRGKDLLGKIREIVDAVARFSQADQAVTIERQGVMIIVKPAAAIPETPAAAIGARGTGKPEAAAGAAVQSEGVATGLVVAILDVLYERAGERVTFEELMGLVSDYDVPIKVFESALKETVSSHNVQQEGNDYWIPYIPPITIGNYRLVRQNGNIAVYSAEDIEQRETLREFTQADLTQLAQDKTAFLVLDKGLSDDEVAKEIASSIREKTGLSDIYPVRSPEEVYRYSELKPYIVINASKDNEATVKAAKSAIGIDNPEIAVYYFVDLQDFVLSGERLDRDVAVFRIQASLVATGV
jgi:hypothetical protein